MAFGMEDVLLFVGLVYVSQNILLYDVIFSVDRHMNRVAARGTVADQVKADARRSMNRTVAGVGAVSLLSWAILELI
jgi:hypothetical protein